MADRSHWGDVEDEETQRVEQVYETPVDDKGTKQRVRITRNDQGQKVRITTKIKVSERRTKVPKRVLQRRNIRKFGLAADCEPELNISTRSPDVIQIEHPENAYKEEEADPLTMAMRGRERALERELELAESKPTGEPEMAVAPARGAEAEPKAEPAEGGNRYVPPSQRMGHRPPPPQDNENTIRVSNLPKETTDSDLRAIFERFALRGRLLRVSMPKKPTKDQGGKAMKEPRGFAYVAFERREDAELAMEKLQRFAFGNLILVLEWAKPQSRDAPPPSGGLNAAFATGYGKALAQDTKEKVSYASNLTR